MDGVGRAGLAAVVVLVGLMAVAVATVGHHDGPSPADPAEELVAAWRRSRTTTYHATGTFERSRPGGNRLSVGVEIAQRPPDRLHRQFGEVSGRRGDRALECPAPADDQPLDCSLGPPGRSFEEVVTDEVRAFERLVVGEDPLYDVRRVGDGCWRMVRTRADPRSGFGLEAVICVDEPTGAVRSVTVDHGDVDERTVYDEISAEVTDDDLEP